MDHSAGTLPGRDVWQVGLANLSDAQEKEPPQAQRNGLIGGFVPNPGAAGDADDCGALELGESVALSPVRRHPIRAA